MAYSSTVTVEPTGTKYEPHPGDLIVVEITETEASSSSEAEISLPCSYLKGYLRRQTCVLTAGSGSSVDPILGTATNPSGASVVVENSDAAATVDNVPAQPVPFRITGGTLYHRSNPDSGSDNSITTRYFIEAR